MPVLCIDRLPYTVTGSAWSLVPHLFSLFSPLSVSSWQQLFQYFAVYLKSLSILSLSVNDFPQTCSRKSKPRGKELPCHLCPRPHHDESHLFWAPPLFLHNSPITLVYFFHSAYNSKKLSLCICLPVLCLPFLLEFMLHESTDHTCLGHCSIPGLST